jgi:hypothetical protein
MLKKKRKGATALRRNEKGLPLLVGTIREILEDVGQTLVFRASERMSCHLEADRALRLRASATLR